MAFHKSSLIPGLGYGQYPSIKQHQQHQSDRRGELPAAESTNTNITIGQSKEPQFLKSIDELISLSAAVDAFKRRYDDLQKHMDYIGNAIDSKLKSNGIDILAVSSSSSLSPPHNDASEETTAIVRQSPPRKPSETVPEMSKKEEAQRLCELMCSKGLRRYIYTNISDRCKLMKELPEALKLAKEPAKFVLEGIGKFYLQGRKAFSRDSPMIPARQASLVILECFLLMHDPGEIKIEGSVKDEAETAAVTWRKRLMSEGGLAAAETMDARGLLLLIASFGVPSIFRNMELLDLIKQSGTAEIAGALKRSPFLIPLISGIVESSIKRGRHIDALELVHTFRIEDRFSTSSVLTAFLTMSKESFERAKRKSNSHMKFKEAIKKQLAALLSVMKFLEAHKLEPVKEVPGWQIKEEIVKLEKDTLQLDKEMEEKARSISLMEEAVLTNRLHNQQMKRPRLSAMEMPPAVSSSYSPIYHDGRHRDGDTDTDEISALVSSYLGPPSAFPHRSILRRSPEYMVPPGGLVRNASVYEHPRPNSIQGQQQIPNGLQSVYRHSPSVERYLGLPNHRSSLDHLGGM